MNRYLRAESKRILTKKSNIIAFLIMLGLVIGGNLLLLQAYKSSGKTFVYGIGKSLEVDSMILMVGLAMALAASSWMVLFIGSITMGDENKERAYLRPVECGISRWNIVVAKFILSMAISILIVFVLIGIHCILVRIFFGWNSLNTQILLFFIQNFALMLIPLFAMLSILLSIYFTVKNEIIVGSIFIFLVVQFSKILDKLSFFTGKAKPVVLIISKYSPSGVFNRISENAYKIFIGEGLEYQLDRNFILDLIPAIITNIFIIWYTTNKLESLLKYALFQIVLIIYKR